LFCFVRLFLHSASALVFGQWPKGSLLPLSEYPVAAVVSSVLRFLLLSAGLALLAGLFWMLVGPRL
jgi:hypothetical protein